MLRGPPGSAPLAFCSETAKPSSKRRRDTIYCLTMALRFENEFSVAAPIEEVWSLLLDLERVAGCLPGASIRPTEESGTFAGSMRVKLGPVAMDYKGTAKLEHVDPQERTATFAIRGKEARGQGTAAATVTNALFLEGDGTRVVVGTNLTITGRPAQFGRGIMQDVADAMLADFARSLSVMLMEGREIAAVIPNESKPQPVESLSMTVLLSKALRKRLRRIVNSASRR
jgi:carbon monoxide dehydrogenase subunit G